VLVERLGTYLAEAFFSIGSNGAFVYRTAASQNQKLIWCDRQGAILGTAGQPGRYKSLAISPDGARAVFSLSENMPLWDLWLLDIARGSRVRLTKGIGMAQDVVWSARGDRVFFGVTGPSPGLYTTAANGTGGADRIADDPSVPTSCSRDGLVLYTQSDVKTGNEIRLASLNGKRDGNSLPGTLMRGAGGQFSPDGRWIAYASGESGRSEVYVVSVTGAGEKRIVSLAGGLEPRWRDSNEIFYLAPDGGVMSAQVTSGADLQVAAPKLLFQAPARATVWDVTSDGKRFLFAVPAEPGAGVFSVSLGWRGEPLGASF
jgi:Tol biopolymer transport system component